MKYIDPKYFSLGERYTAKSLVVRLLEEVVILSEKVFKEANPIRHKDKFAAICSTLLV